MKNCRTCRYGRKLYTGYFRCEHPATKESIPRGGRALISAAPGKVAAVKIVSPSFMNEKTQRWPFEINPTLMTYCHGFKL